MIKRIDAECSDSNANCSRIALNKGDYTGAFHHPKTRRDFKYDYNEDDIIGPRVHSFTTIFGNYRADLTQDNLIKGYFST